MASNQASSGLKKHASSSAGSKPAKTNLALFPRRSSIPENIITNPSPRIPEISQVASSRSRRHNKTPSLPNGFRKGPQPPPSAPKTPVAFSPRIAEQSKIPESRPCKVNRSKTPKRASSEQSQPYSKVTDTNSKIEILVPFPPDLSFPLDPSPDMGQSLGKVARSKGKKVLKNIEVPAWGDIIDTPIVQTPVAGSVATRADSYFFPAISRPRTANTCTENEERLQATVYNPNVSSPKLGPAIGSSGSFSSSPRYTAANLSEIEKQFTLFTANKPKFQRSDFEHLDPDTPAPTSLDVPVPQAGDWILFPARSEKIITVGWWTESKEWEEAEYFRTQCIWSKHETFDKQQPRMCLEH
jgi:hypothetical protein